MNHKILFIINPVSGKGRIKNNLLKIIDSFVKAGHSVKLSVTQASGDIINILSTKDFEYDTIVACGGDGTLNETVNAIMKLNIDVNLGYIPTGTVNDFASSHKINKKPLLAAEQILSFTEYPLDLGVFGDNYFTYVAAFGIFCDIPYTTSQEFKQAMGKFAYFLNGAKHISDLKSFEVQFNCNGVEESGKFILGLISNSHSIGSFKIIKGDISMSDGLLEAMLIKEPKNLIEYQAVINALIQRKDLPGLIYRFQSDNFNFKSEPVTWTLDGEYGGITTDIDIYCKKHALRLLK